MHIKLVTPLFVVAALALTACGTGGGGGSGSAGTSKAEAGFLELPNTSGLQAKPPAGAQPNGIGGAAGFHKDGLTWVVQEQTGEEATKTFDAKKTDTESILFKKWITSEKSADGWVLSYEGPKLDGEGNEKGTMYNFSVRRKIADKQIDCYGSVDQQADLAGAVDACKSLKAI